MESVIQALQELGKGCHGKAIRRERDDFISKRHRLAYDRLAAQKLPRGSGALESAIRRVVNRRLKGAGIFWPKAGAEALLRRRAYDKAGRWNFLKQLVLSPPGLELA